ncbi:MAG: valine--tRNA ligase [Acidobacteria bacterium]|nr:MAG: valine--tRNA ligase [Acidobacteriota bacterium]
MKVEISKTYEAKEVESRWYQLWESKGYFRADAKSARPVFSIVIPPPNVTGSLHMGHMLNHTVHDVIVRRKRMQGFNTLWLPGMDHAGIATQNVVERELRKEGLSRHDIGREKFVERVWQWKEQYGGIILKQIRRIGASCDWSRERFTLDAGLSRAVREVFVRLYEEGLIYRGKRLINWCPRCLTALSDLEVIYEPVDAKLYYIRYPLKGRDNAFVEVATTRPETMLGDTAVAVNPTDERYTKYKGQAVILPLMNREIPFIQDDLVDPAFGTGVVKITPAHDPADFEMGQRHNLPQISVIGEDAKITSAGGPYRGLDRREARKRVLADLEAQGLLARTEPFTHNVGHCQRCHTVVEPLLSTQWFVRIQPLAESAIPAVEQGRTEFVPPKFANDYFAWMRKIRDWCISRQLWWGHRIPAWYCEECGEIVVSRTDVSHCSKCSSAKVRQDDDVLDTWFSSGLWPFSTLGWPDETNDLKTFYPTTLLITAYDIIFFWVARMMMFGLKFMHEVPFKAVYITGIVRDAERQKMSKSKGNVVDPLEICDRYGTDAVRFALARMGAPGTDIAVSDELLDSYRAFATKVWNAARLIFRHVDESERLPSIADLKRSNLGLVDRWILSRLARVTERVNRSIELYNLHEAARNVYDFFKHEFCDWYLEMIKLDPERSKPTLLYVFESALRLLHPFMPFITEELWQNLPHKGESIVIAPYPEFDPELADESAESQTELVQDIIVKVRNIRAEMKVDAKQTVPVRIATNDPELTQLLSNAREYIFKLAQVSQVEIVPKLSGDKLAAQAVAGGLAIEVPLAGLIDVEAERLRLTKEMEKTQREIDKLDRTLSNTSFVDRAPKEVIEENRRRLADYRDQAAKLGEGLKRLE